MCNPKATYSAPTDQNVRNRVTGITYSVLDLSEDGVVPGTARFLLLGSPGIARYRGFSLLKLKIHESRRQTKVAILRAEATDTQALFSVDIPF
jgi:hypothetical protein